MKFHENSSGWELTKLDWYLPNSFSVKAGMRSGQIWEQTRHIKAYAIAIFMSPLIFLWTTGVCPCVGLRISIGESYQKLSWDQYVTQYINQGPNAINRIHDVLRTAMWNISHSQQTALWLHVSINNIFSYITSMLFDFLSGSHPMNHGHIQSIVRPTL